MAYMPVWMLALGWLFFGAAVTRKQVIGAVLSIAGVLLVLLSLWGWRRQVLFDPLGISTEPAFEPNVDLNMDLPDEVKQQYDEAAFAWPKDPQGRHLGYDGLKLTARDRMRPSTSGSATISGISVIRTRMWHQIEENSSASRRSSSRTFVWRRFFDPRIFSSSSLRCATLVRASWRFSITASSLSWSRA